MGTENRTSGWYEDPAGQQGMLRWWDGSTWTEDVKPAGGEPVVPLFQEEPAPVPAPTPHPGSAAALSQFADRPAPVVFEAVDPHQGRKRLTLVLAGVMIAAVAGAGGYFVGAAGKDDKTTPAANSSSAPTDTGGVPGAPAAGNDPASPDGFFGLALTGGQRIPDGISVAGPRGKAAFTLPQGWQPVVLKGDSDIRYVKDPYTCAGRGAGDCSRGLVTQSVRKLDGGWKEPAALALGMSKELTTARLGGTPLKGEPMKNKKFDFRGREAHLIMWRVPVMAGQPGVPAGYCGVLGLKPPPGDLDMPVLQFCVDESPEAPTFATIDQIANSFEPH